MKTTKLSIRLKLILGFILISAATVGISLMSNSTLTSSIEHQNEVAQTSKTVRLGSIIYKDILFVRGDAIAALTIIKKREQYEKKSTIKRRWLIRPLIH